jgi:hypothetical protein
MAQLVIAQDTHPGTGEPAVCFSIGLMDEESTVASVWYGPEAMRVVADLVEQAVAALEQRTEGDESNG